MKKYTLSEIKRAIEDIFAIYGRGDGWDVPVVYEDVILSVLNSALKRVTKKRK